MSERWWKRWQRRAAVHDIGTAEPGETEMQRPPGSTTTGPHDRRAQSATTRADMSQPTAHVSAPSAAKPDQRSIHAQARQPKSGRTGQPPQPKTRPAQRPSASGGRVHWAFNDERMLHAWRQLKANGGGPGVDGVDITSFEASLKEHLAVLQAELSQGSYRPQPVRRVLIPKRNEGLRPLAVWTLRDRLAQRAVLNAVEPLFEPVFLPCSHGFRPGRSVQTATEMVCAARDEGLRWVLDADIKECFENIDPALLMRLVRQRLKDKRLLGLIDCWLQAQVLTAGGQMRAAGTAQGGVLSPLLCNVYLHEFDAALMQQHLRLVRYADDFVVLQRRRKEVEAAQRVAQAALADLQLEFNLYKTRIVNFDQGFKFLGMFFVRDEVFVL